MADFRKNFLEILTARQLGNKQAVHEASLSRIMQHAQNAPEKGFAILSSFRAANTKAQNFSGLAKLKNQVRGMGFGYVTLVGHWLECQNPDIPYEECPKDQLVDATEVSLFVVGVPMKAATALGREYQQDAIIYGGPETDGKVHLIFNDGGSKELGAFSPMTISQGYSELKQSKGKAPRNFRFEYVEWPTQGQTESVLEESFRKLVPF